VTSDAGPVVAIFEEIQAADSKWHADVADPRGEPGWISGTDFERATEGPFGRLLRATGDRLGTADRKTVAALFALRFGWAASVAIAPYLTHACVPDISLGNVSLKFRDDTLYERSALHCPRATMVRGTRAAHPLIETVADRVALQRVLRRHLCEQTRPVVRALHEWSGFSVRGAWGMVTSSWASHFIAGCDRLEGQVQAISLLEDLCAGDDDVARMQPRLHPVTLGVVTHVFQRRASCCRYYLLPKGSLCASCPLVSQEERVRRNLEWMQRLLSRS
jgi:ferric iron reductase protein FhuF